METSILPILRVSAARALAAIYDAGDTGVHLSELARRLGMSLTTVHRAVERLEAANLVQSTQVAGVRILKPNRASPYAQDLGPLLRKAFGPATAVREALAPIDGIERVAIFGSWAARMAGIPGPDPNDIDVLVVGRVPIQAVDSALIALERELGREVQPTVVSADDWENAESGFLKTVRQRPLTWVLGPDA